MSDAFTILLRTACAINWIEWLKAAASIATAAIAFAALRNWRRQDKAKREAEFLDALIEATHAYMAAMPIPMTHLQVAKIGIESHAPTWEAGGKAEIAVKGAIAYINKNGVQAAADLRSALEMARPSLVTLRSLSAKGQVFRFKGYEKSQEFVRMIAWPFDRLQAFAAIIGSITWNWEHPDVLKQLNNAIDLVPEDLVEILNQNSASILEFTAKTYSRIYP